MLKKNTIRPINMTDHDPVLDLDDCMNTKNNLGSVLSELFSRKKLPEKRRKILVLVSRVGYSGEEPYRYEEEKTYTFGYLCRIWKEWTDKEFDKEKFEGDKAFEMACHEKQAQRRSAWGAYMQTMNNIRLEKEESEFQKKCRSMSSSERIEAEKERDKNLGAPLLYIG